MKNGDLVKTKGIKVYGDGQPVIWETYSPTRGQRFVFLLLGMEDERDPWTTAKAVEALNQMGWVQAKSAKPKS